jgi:dihydroorotase
LKFPVFDMPTTLSKFMAMGLSLSKVIECSTSMPASVLGLEGQIGTLGVGAEADIAVFEMKEGDFTFMDVRSKTINGEKMLKATDVIKSGEIVFPRNNPSQ